MHVLRAQGVEIGEPEYIARTAWTTDELLDAIDAEDPRGPYDLVTLLVGVNDQYRARPAKSFEAGFRDVLRRSLGLAGKRATRLVALSIPDWGATPFASGRDGAAIARDIDGYNALAQAAVAERGAAWVDVTVVSRRMRTEPALVVEDGLHPSGALYELWAKLAVPAALRALAAKQKAAIAR